MDAITLDKLGYGSSPFSNGHCCKDRRIDTLYPFLPVTTQLMNVFKGRHFNRDIILGAVRWYCKYGISYRELQEILAERGVNVDHTTIYRWVQRYAPEMKKRLCLYWRTPSGFCSWRLDEMYIKVNGRWAYLYRAVDRKDCTIDFLSLTASQQ